MPILGAFSQLLPLLAVGYLIGRFKPGFSSQIAAPLINYGIPVSLMGLLLKSGLDWLLFQAMILAFFAIGLLIIVLRTLPSFRRRIGCGSLLLGSVFGNSGYFGIPISLALLPSGSLSFSIGYDLGATLLVWSLGPMLLANSSSKKSGISAATNFFTALTSSPASKGFIGAVLVQLTPWSNQITSALWIPSRIVIVLALMIVGIRLGSFNHVQKLVDRNFFLIFSSSLLIKLIILPSLMLALAKAFGLSMLMTNAVVLQAATPTAISVLLLAEASGQEQEVAASLVAFSTLIALLTVPIWVLILHYL